MSLPFLAFLLATRGEIRVGGEERSVRIFLVQEDKTQGIGIAGKRPLPNQVSCHKTSVIFLMWQGQGENTTYCLCPETGVMQCPP